MPGTGSGPRAPATSRLSVSAIMTLLSHRNLTTKEGAKEVWERCRHSCAEEQHTVKPYLAGGWGGGGGGALAFALGGAQCEHGQGLWFQT